MNLKHELRNKGYNENNIRSLKSYIKYILKSNKRSVLIFSSILFGVVLFNMIIALLIIKFSSSNSSSTVNSGALMSGFISVSIMASVSALVWTSKAEVNKAFVFPINRQIYALGNFISSIMGSFIFLIITSLISIFEILMGNLIAMIFNNFVFINEINMSNFIPGFFVSLSYLMLFIAASYCFGVYFVKNKIIVSAILGFVFILAITFPWPRQAIVEVFKFFFYEKSIAISCLKLWGTAMILHIAAFIPVRSMEVKV